jgi:hypothetical protein
MTCEAFVDFYAGNDLCGEPAAGTVFAACEHEHINDRPACVACLAELQRDDGWQCAHCDHKCLLRLEIRWLSGEVTVLSSADNNYSVKLEGDSE